MIKAFTIFIILISKVLSEPDNSFIRSIQLNGNENVSLNEILYLVRQRPPNFFFRRPKFNPRLLKLDALTLKNYYHSKGFLDVEIKNSYENEKNFVDIKYDIIEGKRYYLSKVNVDGNKLINDYKIKKILGLKVGNPYNPVLINDNLYQIENEYHELGKLFMGIIIEDQILDSVQVNIKINEGKNIYVKNTYIENNGDIDTSLIIRELIYGDNELFSKRKVDISTRRLREMNVFSLVNIVPVKVINSDSLVNMVVELNNYKQREWNSIGGYDPIQFADGAEPIPAISVTTEWRNRSFFNSPTQFSTKLLAGIPVEEEFIIPRIRYDVSLSSNWFLGIRFPSKITAYYETFFDNWEDQNLNQKSLKLLERRGLNLSQHLNFDNRSFIETKSILESFSDDSEKKDQIEQRAVSIKVNYDKKDDPIFTRKGYLASSILKLAGFGGERDYLKIDFNFQFYKMIKNQSVLATRLKIGSLIGWNDKDLDYSYEKFYLGGSTSMRGWDVLRFEQTNSNEPVGKVNRFMINCEYRYPINKLLGITIFADGGILSNHISTTKLGLIKWNNGMGLAIQTPLGPARIDYAFQTKNPEIWKIQLGVQNLF